jgi:hypothetical protein
MDASGKRASKIFSIAGIVGALALGAIVRRANHVWDEVGGASSPELERMRVTVLEMPSMAFSGGLRSASWNLEAGRAELASAREDAALEAASQAPPAPGLDVGRIGR